MSSPPYQKPAFPPPIDSYIPKQARGDPWFNKGNVIVVTLDPHTWAKTRAWRVDEALLCSGSEYFDAQLSSDHQVVGGCKVVEIVEDGVVTKGRIEDALRCLYLRW
jgi:hypothetical protein